MVSPAETERASVSTLTRPRRWRVVSGRSGRSEGRAASGYTPRSVGIARPYGRTRTRQSAAERPLRCMDDILAGLPAGLEPSGSAPAVDRDGQLEQVVVHWGLLRLQAPENVRRAGSGR